MAKGVGAMRHRVILVLVLLVLVAPSCSSSDEVDHPEPAVKDVATDDSAPASDPADDSNTVRVTSFAFGPRELTIAVGDSITWVNDSRNAHTSSGRGGEWHWDLAVGGTGTETFSEVGTFDYFCAFHDSMTGTITVEG